jgi:AcrR family transcriptional regulator
MNNTKDIIINKTAVMFARTGSLDFSIRNLAKQVPITPSVIYHYFENEEDLLLAMYLFLNKELGEKRAILPITKTAAEMLKQRIEFQIENQEEIVAVLKYYFSHRKNFKKNKKGFVPDKSALHIEEVLKFGIETNEFTVDNLEDESKVIAHAINGFLLEYYPYKPKGKEKKELVERIYKFIIRALKGGEKK